MEVMPGYKWTEVGAIPDNWTVRKLRDIADINPDNLDDMTQSDYAFKYISLEDVDNGVLKGLSELVFHSAPSRARRKVRQGDVLLASVRPNLKSHLFLRDDISDLICSTGFTVIRCRPSEADPGFVFYHLFADVIERQINSLVTGSNYPAISSKDVGTLNIPMPAVPEQKTIVAILSNMDAFIIVLNQLIAKKRDIKQGAMQELLMGRKRLPGHNLSWKVCILADLGTFSKGKEIKKDDIVDDGIPCIRYGEIYTHYNDYTTQFHSHISPETAKESQQIRRGDLLFTGSGETAEEIGKCVAYLGEGGACAGGDIIIFSPIENDSLFLSYLMNHTTSVVNQKTRMGQGDAIVHISKRNIAHLRLQLPASKDEQSAIANNLLHMDTEIATLEAKRDKIILLKQGMMQNLLIGRKRLT